MLSIEDLIEEGINFDSMGDLSLESGVVLRSWLQHDLVVVIMKLDVS
jgi:hypothetical protein